MGEATYLGDHDVVGVAVSGVEFTRDPLVNKFDSCVGHVYLASRAYHYHLSPSCLLESMGIAAPSSVAVASGNVSKWTADGAPMIIGWARDGFPMYTPWTDAGDLVTSGDLDECNGAVVDGAYRYYVTPDTPFVPRCLKGTVIGEVSFTTPDPLTACPRGGRNVSYVADGDVPLSGRSCVVATTYEGYLVDTYSWEQTTDRFQYTVATMLAAAEDTATFAGFGVLEELPDGSFALKYTFDAAGNDLLVQKLQATAMTEDFAVIVSGDANGGVLESLESALVVGEAITVTGHLIDLFCWIQPGHVGIDGTPLDTMAPRHGNWCLRDIQQCRDNGYGVLTRQSDGTYDLAYAFDDVGHENSRNFVDVITKFDDIIVHATGIPTADGVLTGATLVLADLDTVELEGTVVRLGTTLAAHVSDLLQDTAFGLVVADGVYYEFDAPSNAALLLLLEEEAETAAFFAVEVNAVKVTGSNVLTMSVISKKAMDETTAAPTTTTQMSCESDDPNFDFALALDSKLTFYWRLDSPQSWDATVVGRLLKKGGGFAAIAASLDAFMPGSDAIIGDENSVPEKYFLEARAPPSKRSVQTLTATSTTVLSNGDVDMRFTKILVEPGEIPILPEGSTSFIWAHGDGGLAFHGNNRGALDLDLSTCAFSERTLTPVKSQAIKIHGMLMVAAWAYLAPLGILMARAKTTALRYGFVKTWLYLHLLIQLTVLLCTAIGFAKVFETIKDSDVRDHLTFRHPKLGVGVMVGGLTQLLMGVLRPHPPHAGDSKTIPRFIFEIAHRLNGYGTAVLALLTMLAGIHKALELKHIDYVYTWNAAVLAPIATAAFLGLLVTAFTLTTKQQPLVSISTKMTPDKTPDVISDAPPKRFQDDV